MIRIVENESIIPLRRYCADDPFGCRILAAFETYGLCEPFAQFWLQINESGEITAAICALDNALTVCTKGEHDAEELDLFFNMLSGSTRALRKKRPGESAEGFVFRLSKACEAECKAEFSLDPEALYSVLEKSGENIPKESFCTDMRARKKAGVLLCAVLPHRSEYASCCALHKAGTAALLFAVATVPKYRRLGLAGKCIAAAAKESGCTSIYALAKPELRGFYEKLGFSVIDEYVC